MRAIAGMRLLKGFILTVLSLYLVALAAIWYEQRDLMYVPTLARVSPEAAGFAPAQTLILSTADNQRLIAWFRPPDDRQPLILYFHGNTNNLDRDAKRLTELAAGGYGVFAPDYRGYGGSTGSPTEEGLLLDAEAAYAEVIARGIAPANIMLYGHSLGSGVAVAMAARHKVAGLILEAPFTSALDVAAERYWMFPTGWLMQDPFHSDTRIVDVHAPLLILHGTADQIIPYHFGQSLFALANEPKQFITLPQAGHMLLLRPGVSDQIHQWINATMAKAAGLQ